MKLIDIMAYSTIWGTIEYICVFFTASFILLKSYKILIMLYNFSKWVIKK